MAVAQTNEDVITLAAGGDIYSATGLTIKYAVWEGAVTAGDDIKITDKDSGTLLAETKARAYETLELVGLRGYNIRNGIKLVTIDSGKLFLYL